MANLTYNERLALERERDRLRREREDERRNGVAGTRANDSRIVRNDNAMHGQAGRKWLGGEQGAVSDGSAMHGKAGRKWLGLGGSQDEEPRRSNISVYSNVDQLGGGRAPTVYEAGSDDDPTKEWTTAGLRQKAINAQRLLDQFKVSKNQRIQDAANSANADNEVLGRLFLSAFQTPRQLGADGRPMNTDMDANDIAQIVGNNQRFAGISRAGIRMQDLGSGAKVPVLVYEKGGQTFMLDPNQAFAAANAFTGSQKATLSAISGKGLAGAFGAKENKPSAVDVANARGEQGFLNSALKAAIVEDAEGNKVFSDEIFDKMVAAYKRAFGGGTATPAPTGGDEGKGANAVGTTLTKEQLEKQKQGGAIQMDQKGKTQNAATTAQPAQTQPAAPQNTAGVVEDAKPKYRGGQQQLDLLISDDNEANGYRRVTTNGYIGNDGKFYDGKGQQINGVVGTFKTDYERDASGNVVRNEKGNPARYVYTDSKFKDELEKRKQKQGDASGNNGETQKTQPAAKSAATAKTSTSSETATATSATPTETATAPNGGEKPKITGRQLNEDRRKRNRFDFAEHYGVSDSVLARYQRLNPTANIARDNTKAANEMARLADFMGESETAKKIRAALKSDSDRRNSILSIARGYANSRETAAHEKEYDALEQRVRDEIMSEAIAKGKDKAWIDREIVVRIDNGVRRQRRNASAALGNANPSEDDLRRAEGEYSREKAISDTIDARRRDERDEFYGFTTGGPGGKNGKPPRTLADIQRDIDEDEDRKQGRRNAVANPMLDESSERIRGLYDRMKAKREEEEARKREERKRVDRILGRKRK